MHADATYPLVTLLPPLGHPAGPLPEPRHDPCDALPYLRSTPYTSALAPYSRRSLLDLEDPKLDRTGWTATATSVQNNGVEAAPAVNAIDGLPGTSWSSKWNPSVDSMPHRFTMSMDGRLALVFRLTVLPRQDANPSVDGNIGGFQVHLSSDGNVYSPGGEPPVATGTWPNTLSEKTVSWPAAYARGVRLTVTSSASPTGLANVASAAEIWVHGYYIRAFSHVASGTFALSRRTLTLLLLLKVAVRWPLAVCALKARC